MNPKSSKYFVTTPIFYVNSSPHLGHYYTVVAADFIARFQRLSGLEVKLLTGTDEHGQKVEQSAQKAGLPPQQFVDELLPQFRAMTKLTGSENYDFIRTTDPRHQTFVQHIWRQMEAKGHIYLGKYSGWYSVRDERFYAESELVDGKAPTGAEVEWVEEDSYFFRLSAFQEQLLQLYAAHPDFVAPQGRYNEVIAFVKGGLKDLSVSRVSFSWGIPVPDAPQHVIYVWLDALFNYMSALDMAQQPEFWPCDLHLIGKDILHFHAVYWPAFLLALDLPLPQRIFAHGWWLNNGEKMSKSLGNVIAPQDLVAQFGNEYLRYFLLREVPFGQDGDFREAAMCERINADLANNLGNLINRCMTFIHKHCEAKIPQFSIFMPEDREILDLTQQILSEITIEMNLQRLHQALALIVQCGHKLNFYVNAMAPWALKKTDPERMQTVLYVVAEAIRVLGILLQPIMPEKAAQILGLYARYGSDGAVRRGVQFAEIAGAPLVPGEAICEPRIIFAKLDAAALVAAAG